MTVIDGIRGWGEVGKLLSYFSLYALSDFLFSV